MSNIRFSIHNPDSESNLELARIRRVQNMISINTTQPTNLVREMSINSDLAVLINEESSSIHQNEIESLFSMYNMLGNIQNQSYSVFDVINRENNILNIILNHPLDTDDNQLRRNTKNKITAKSVSYNTTIKGSKECAICIEDFKDDDKVIVIDCNHIFHTNCITEWSYYKTDCPVCRTKIPIVNDLL